LAYIELDECFRRLNGEGASGRGKGIKKKKVKEYI